MDTELLSIPTPTGKRTVELDDVSIPIMVNRVSSLQHHNLGPSRGSISRTLTRAPVYKEASRDNTRVLFDPEMAQEDIESRVSTFLWSHLTPCFLTLLTLFLGLIFWPTDARWPSPHYPLVHRWLFFMSMCFAGYLVALVVERIVLNGLKAFAVRFRLNIAVLIQRSLRRVLAPSLLFIFILFTKGAWEDWFFEGTQAVIDDVQRILLTLLIITMVMLFRKVVNSLIFWKLDLEYHVKTLSAYEKEEWIIEALCAADPRAFGSKAEEHSDHPIDSVFSTPMQNEKKTTLKFLARNDRLSSLKTRVKVREFAGKLFNHIDAMQKGHVTLQDLDEYFESDDAMFAFLLFKQGASNTPIDSMLDVPEPCTIELAVFEESLVRMYTARLTSITELQSTSSASSIMIAGVTALSWVSIPFIIAGMSGVDVNTIILTTTSLLISFSFAFGSSISRMVEGAYFLFVTKPFNVGDRILPGNPSTAKDMYIVMAIDLMTTTARTNTNKLVILPNYALASQNLINYNRLPHATVVIDLDIAAKTPQMKLLEFETKLKKFLRQNRDKWRPSSYCMFKEQLVNVNQLTIQLWIQSQYSWQEGLNLWTARSELMDHVRESFLALGVSYVQAPVRVEVSKFTELVVS